MKPICTLQNLSLSYPHKIIFNKVNLTINEGDKIGVLGLNGHGKSSLFKILSDSISPDITTPAFIYDKTQNYECFCVPQEMPQVKVKIHDYLYEFYPHFKVLKDKLNKINDAITDGDYSDAILDQQQKLLEELHRLGEDDIHQKYLSLLKYFGLLNDEAIFTSMSGGEQRKVALCLGLSSRASLILWDEPTNHLDLETILLFEEELMDSRNTFMMISHDRSLLQNIVDKIFHIQKGKLFSFQGTYEQYLTYLQEEEARREKELDRLSNHNRRETAWIKRGAKARRTKSKKRIEDYDTLHQKIRDLKDQAHKSVELNIQSSGRKSKLLFQALDLGLSYGDRTIFKNLNFKIAKGDKISILGRNGAGKTSLLNLMQGIIQPTSGKIDKLDQLQIGYFSQNRASLKDSMTPWELVGDGIDFVYSNTGDKRHVASYLESFLFSSDEIKRPIHTFSGGEKNRLQLAQFMKNAQDIWIFDEPTNDLDLETIGILEEELKNYEGALIIVSHDRSFIENVTNKCWVLHDQELEQFDGGFEQAQTFLEAIVMEEELLKNQKTKPIKNTPAPVTKSQLTSKEKDRLIKLPVEIEKIEAEIEKIKSKLEHFKFEDTSLEARNELKKLQTNLSDAESKQTKLFDEWSELEAKSK